MIRILNVLVLLGGFHGHTEMMYMVARPTDTRYVVSIFGSRLLSYFLYIHIFYVKSSPCEPCAAFPTRFSLIFQMAQQNSRSCDYEFQVSEKECIHAKNNCLDSWPSLRADQKIVGQYGEIYRCTKPTCTGTLTVRKSGSGFLISHSLHNHEDRFGRAFPSSSLAASSHLPFPEHPANGLVDGEDGIVERILYDTAKNARLPPHVTLVRDVRIQAKLAEQHGVNLRTPGIVLLADLEEVGAVQRKRSPALSYATDMVDITGCETIIYATLPTPAILPTPNASVYNLRSRSCKTATSSIAAIKSRHKTATTTSTAVLSTAALTTDATTPAATTAPTPPATPSNDVEADILTDKASSVMVGIMQASSTVTSQTFLDRKLPS